MKKSKNLICSISFTVLPN